MSIIDTSRMSPKVREVFMLADAAIMEWDVNAHKRLDGCIKFNKRILVDADPDRVFGHKFAAVIIAVIINAAPGSFLWEVVKERPLHWDIIGYCIGFIALTSGAIALHRWIVIRRLRRSGAVWRWKINRLIDAAKSLNRNERQELYAAMYAAGLDIRQAKRNAYIAYQQGFNDGFILGGDDYCHY